MKEDCKELATRADLAVAQASLERKIDQARKEIEQSKSSLLRWQTGTGAALLALMASGFGALIYMLAKAHGWAGF